MSESDSEPANAVAARLKEIATTHLDGNGSVSVNVTMRPGGDVLAIIESTAAEQLNGICNQFEHAARGVDGVRQARIIFTAHASQEKNRPAPSPRSADNPQRPPTGPRITRRTPRGTDVGKERTPMAVPAKAASGKPNSDINHVIAVASAKGGVGKSTVAVNMAVAAARDGLRVGLLDADIHGPSIPIMLGTADARHEISYDNGQKKLTPIVAHGIQSASMGYIAERDQAVVWRGPMVSSALWQLFDQVTWGTLDLLIVDTPPGTGDVLLTLVQKISPTGVVIVTTPQEVAVADVARGQQMFEKTGTPVLGVIENMSYYQDSSSGERIHMFGRGGGQRAADAFGVPLLSTIPIDPAIGISCDQGRPPTLDDADSHALYRKILHRLKERVSRLDC